jgi:hypothetical protein
MIAELSKIADEGLREGLKGSAAGSRAGVAIPNLWRQSWEVRRRGPAHLELNLQETFQQGRAVGQLVDRQTADTRGAYERPARTLNCQSPIGSRMAW